MYFITIEVTLFSNEPDLIVSTIETYELSARTVKEIEEAVKEEGSIYMKLTCLNDPSSGSTSLSLSVSPSISQG